LTTIMLHVQATSATGSAGDFILNSDKSRNFGARESMAGRSIR
jgi:hypothetical protein